MSHEVRRVCGGPVAIALGLLLGGCDAQFSAELGTFPPADPDIDEVRVNLRGLEFRKSDGATPTLEFRDGELVDLLDLQVGEPLRMFTDEELPAGSYTGVRLLFDADEGDNAVTTVDGEFPLLLADGAYAAVDFSVEDEERSRESLTLALDLRQSLRFDGARDEYTLAPQLRAIRTGDAADVAGDVRVACPVGTSLATGGAVYLFSGRDVDPDDLDGAGAEPLATTVVSDSTLTGFRYALRFLPAGAHTLALTCRGDEDVLGVDDALDFRSSLNVELDAGETLEVDFD